MAATARRRAAKRPAIPYPASLETSAPSTLFWRAAWLRDAAQVAALNEHVDAVWGQRKVSSNPALRTALSMATIGAERAADHSFECLVNCGGLLYAWLPEGGAA